MPKLQVATIENCKLKIAYIENCQNWKLLKLPKLKIVNCQNCKLLSCELAILEQSPYVLVFVILDKEISNTS